MTEDEGYGENNLGIILIAVNSIVLVMTIISMCIGPIMRVINIFVSKHIHECEIKGLGGVESREEVRTIVWDPKITLNFTRR